MKKTEYTSALLREKYTYVEHASGLPIYVFPKEMTGTYALFAMTGALTRGDAAGAAHYVHEFYFESAAMILALITVGKMLEARAKGKTTDALKRRFSTNTHRSLCAIRHVSHVPAVMTRQWSCSEACRST